MDSNDNVSVECCGRFTVLAVGQVLVSAVSRTPWHAAGRIHPRCYSVPVILLQ